MTAYQVLEDSSYVSWKSAINMVKYLYFNYILYDRAVQFWAFCLAVSVFQSGSWIAISDADWCKQTKVVLLESFFEIKFFF